jgi:hypothetical protein
VVRGRQAGRGLFEEILVLFLESGAVCYNGGVERGASKLLEVAVVPTDLQEWDLRFQGWLWIWVRHAEVAERREAPVS